MVRYKSFILIAVLFSALVLGGCKQLTRPSSDGSAQQKQEQSQAVVVVTPAADNQTVTQEPKPQSPQVKTTAVPFVLRLQVPQNAVLYYGGQACGAQDVTFTVDAKGLPPLQELTLVYQLSNSKGSLEGRMQFQRTAEGRYQLTLKADEFDTSWLAEEGATLSYAFVAVSQEGQTSRYPTSGWAQAELKACTEQAKTAPNPGQGRGHGQGQAQGQGQGHGQSQGQGQPGAGQQGNSPGGQAGSGASSGNNAGSTASGGNTGGAGDGTVAQPDNCAINPNSPECLPTLDLGSGTGSSGSGLADGTGGDSGTGTVTLDCTANPDAPGCQPTLDPPTVVEPVVTPIVTNP